MLLLKVSTAYTAKIGPFLDSTDGNTEETGLTIAQADVKLSKNGGALAQKNDATGCTHDANGWYACPLDTTDTGTLGKLQLSVHVAGALFVWHEFMVLPANVYDSLVSAADALQVHANEITDGLITAAAIATGAIDADALAADAVDEILDEVVEGTLTLRQVVRLFLSVLAGKSSGGGTGSVAFRDNADSKNRISATVDTSGNRTAVTLDGS